MTLPTSGPLTFADIQTEFGGSNPIGINEYYAGGSYVAAGTTGTYGAVPSSGQISVQNFYGTSAIPPVYIQDVFATNIYTGNDSTQTITNNINISGNGALVWVKGRSGTYGNFDHTLINTPISNTKAYSSNNTGDGFGLGGSAFSPTTTGFNLNTASASLNNSGTNYVAWAFRKQAKFFDLVTWTGNGAATQTISHNLGSVPGCIINKKASGTGDWWTYDRAATANPLGAYGVLNSSNGWVNVGPAYDFWSPTSTTFKVDFNFGLNTSGETYFAYLFAHNAGGFGASGAENVISCGSFVSDIAGSSIYLGYQPQYLMVKIVENVGLGWYIVDAQRGFTLGSSSSQALTANSASAEGSLGWFTPTSTGFDLNAGQLSSGYNYIYIAIRKPM
jgi:hypothetical protein